MTNIRNKSDYQKHVANMFIEGLKDNGLKWKRGWETISAPCNAITLKPYTKDNAFYLSFVSAIKGYSDPRFVTFNQIADEKYHKGEKWHLQKGAKSEIVIYTYPYDYKEQKSYTWKEYYDLPEETREKIGLSSRPYYVFNAKYIDGIKPLEADENKIEGDKLIDTLANNMGVEIDYDGNGRNYYISREDKIHLTNKVFFNSELEYNETALHEFAHATGHESRLNRIGLSNNKTEEDYAYEELIAEISAAFMSHNLNESPDTLDIDRENEWENNHKAYINSWISQIGKDPKVLSNAIKEAHEATEFMEEKAGLLPEKELETASEMASRLREENKLIGLYQNIDKGEER